MEYIDGHVNLCVACICLSNNKYDTNHSDYSSTWSNKLNDHIDCCYYDCLVEVRVVGGPLRVQPADAVFNVKIYKRDKCELYYIRNEIEPPAMELFTEFSLIVWMPLV